MKTFKVRQKIRFGQIDALGVAFYPRLVEMLNNTIEDFFEHVVGYSYRQMHIEEERGVPTVNLNIDFKNSVYLGDELTWSLNTKKVGNSSFTVQVTAMTDDVVNLSSEATLVFVEGISCTLCLKHFYCSGIDITNAYNVFKLCITIKTFLFFLELTLQISPNDLINNNILYSITIHGI